MNLFLPVVKPAVAGPLEQDMNGVESEIEYIKQHLKRLDVENPVISFFIRNFAKSTNDKRGAATCALMVYRLLESQAEANRMNFEFQAEDVESEMK
jgi:hypothetical protein